MAEFELYNIMIEVKNYLINKLNKELMAAGLMPIDNYRVGLPMEDSDSELRACGVYTNADEGAAIYSEDDESLAISPKIAVHILLNRADDYPANGADSVVEKYADVVTRLLSEHVFSSGSSVYQVYPGHAFDIMRPDVVVLMTVLGAYTYYED